MNTFIITCPCHFGLEAPLKREIYDLGYDVNGSIDGRVSFTGDAEAIVRANIFLRGAERVLIEVGRFKATSFEALFEGIKSLPWEDYIPRDGRFWVTKATSVKSALFSLSDIQSVAKKAMVARLGNHFGMSIFPEDGHDYPVRIFILKDEVVVTLDSSGTLLHKRGYRTWTSKAPISETMAASLINLTPWKPDRILVDPFCGSGTFLIEAAMMAASIAPGLNREFTSMDWTNIIEPKLWKDVLSEAREMVDTSVSCDLQGYDIDPEMIKIARANAKQAGVDHMIHFQTREVAKLSHPKKYGFIITNPPYGERLEEKSALPTIYGQLRDAYNALDNWSMYVITSYEDFEAVMGKKCDKNRKVYNGMIKTYYYQYMGQKPPKKTK